MPKNIMYLNKQLKIRKSEREYEQKSIGSIFKFQRLKYDMILEEVSEGICSVSYLSKLENDLVELSDRFRDPLLKRLKLEDYQFNIEDNMTEDLTHLLNHIIENKEIPSFFFEKYQDKIDYQSRLIQMTIHICKKQYNQVDGLYEQISPYSTQLTNMELALFLLNTSYMLTEKGHYEESFDILTQSPYLEVENLVLILLTRKQKCMNAFKMHKANAINALYDDLFLSFAKAQFYDHLCEIQGEMLIYQSLYWPVEKIQTSISKMHKMSQSDKDYILARTYYNHMLYQDAYIISNTHQETSTKWHVLHLMILAHLDEKSTQILNIINKVKVSTQEDIKVKEFIIMKTTLPINEFVEYLRGEFFTKKWMVEDNFSLSYIMLTAQDVFSKVHYYKDATKVMQKYYRIHRSLTGSSVSF